MKKYLLLLILSFFILINGVYAKDYSKELFKAGDKVVVNKKLDGTAFIAGNNISIDEKIDGIGFIAGNNIKINSIEDYIFSAGNDIVLNSVIEKDLFLAGSNIEVRGSSLKRDAYIAGQNVEVDAVVDRNIYIYGDKVELNGIYNGNIKIYANTITIKDDAAILGTLKYNEEATIRGLSDNIKTKTYKTTSDKKETLYSSIINVVSSYIHITIFALVLVYIFDKHIKKLTNEKYKDAVVNSGKGFLILLGLPIISLIFMLTGLLVSVGVVSLLVYGIMIYISTIISAYLLAYVLDNNYFKKNMNNYLLVFIGLSIIYVLKLVPILGGFVTFVSIIYGLGMIGNIVLNIRK